MKTQCFEWRTRRIYCALLHFPRRAVVFVHIPFRTEGRLRVNKWSRFWPAFFALDLWGATHGRLADNAFNLIRSWWTEERNRFQWQGLIERNPSPYIALMVVVRWNDRVLQVCSKLIVSVKRADEKAASTIIFLINCGGRTYTTHWQIARDIGTERFKLHLIEGLRWPSNYPKKNTLWLAEWVLLD